MKRAQLAVRNQPGRFFVAAADPSVADESITTSRAIGDLADAALMTDGVARLVTLFGTHSWERVLEALSVAGPDALVRSVRKAESLDASLKQWPRTKNSDDATVAYVRF